MLFSTPVGAEEPALGLFTLLEFGLSPAQSDAVLDLDRRRVAQPPAALVCKRQPQHVAAQLLVLGS